MLPLIVQESLFLEETDSPANTHREPVKIGICGSEFFFLQQIIEGTFSDHTFMRTNSLKSASKFR